jgi:hypothetical protein
MDDRFPVRRLFAGKSRRSQDGDYEALAAVDAALVFYEAPHRVGNRADLAELLQPQRDMVIARELTKLFEQIERLPLGRALAWLEADTNHQRGEFVLIVSAPPLRNSSELETETERVLTALLAELPVKQAVKLALKLPVSPKMRCMRSALQLKSDGSIIKTMDTFTILTRPDDWHLHLRDGAALAAVLPDTARRFARAIVMPNLKPPVTTVALAAAYRQRILAALPAGLDFTPLMTLYLTDNRRQGDRQGARRAGLCTP